MYMVGGGPTAADKCEGCHFGCGCFVLLWSCGECCWRCFVVCDVNVFVFKLSGGDSELESLIWLSSDVFAAVVYLVVDLELMGG